MILIEENFQEVITEATEQGEGKKYYLKGVFAEAETKNRNGRIYSLSEMKREVEKINAAAAQGRHVLGELDHPSVLEVKLKNVSHKILEMEMRGNKAIGKAEILQNHPNGQIVIGLMKDGVQLGVSTRGSGKVNSKAIVEGFNLITVDIVHTPSARSAYPESLMEAVEMHKSGIITDLAEAVIYDKSAQKYFQKELRAFVETLKGK